MIQIDHSNTCSTSTNIFCYFSLQWKRQIWIFSKWKFISQVPTEQWKLVSLSDLFVFRVYSRIAGRSQDQMFDNFPPHMFTTSHNVSFRKVHMSEKRVTKPSFALPGRNMSTNELMAQKSYFPGCHTCLVMLFELNMPSV